MLKESIIKFLKLENLVENLTGYVETRIELMKYELREDISKVVSKVIVYLMVTFILTFFLFFLSLATALKLSESLGDFNGFAVVSLFYVAVGITLYLFRKPLSGNIERKLKNLTKHKIK